ncbi:uncharacterized protein METZ01_LOCUS401825, partial [marine metagenome]
NDVDPCPESIPATFPGAVADDVDGDGCLGGGAWLQDNGNDWYCDTALCDDGDDNTWCYCEDDDDDDDGANDGVDIDDNDKFVCSDNDNDLCDDCSSGTFDPDNDGDDFDGDGLCDVGDPQPDCFDNDDVGCGCGADGAYTDDNGNDIGCGGMPDEFTYNLSTYQAFYYISSVKDMYDNELSAGDWVAAFNGDICVGAREWDCSNSICDVPAMGNDGFTWSGTENYLNIGDIPSFRIYDASEDTYFDVTPSENYGFEIYGTFGIDKLMLTMDYSIDLHDNMNLI